MKETAYLLQAALVSIWWIGLSLSPTFFTAFQFEEISPTAFWAFFAPDIVFIATLSLIRAYKKLRGLELVLLGAVGYASLYCLNATVLTRSGLLPTGLMLLALAYNFFLCYNAALFRSSRSTNMIANASKTLVQVICIWALALVVVPYVLLEAFGPYLSSCVESFFWIGVVLFVCFSILGVLSSFYMVRDGGGTPLPLDQPNHLVQSGPYRFVRNPMAIAGIGQGIAIAIMFQSPAILVYALLGIVVWQLVVRTIEERDMVRRFGEPYLAYRQRVACWLPTIRGGA